MGPLSGFGCPCKHSQADGDKRENPALWINGQNASAHWWLITDKVKVVPKLGQIDVEALRERFEKLISIIAFDAIADENI